MPNHLLTTFATGGETSFTNLDDSSTLVLRADDLNDVSGKACLLDQTLIRMRQATNGDRPVVWRHEYPRGGCSDYCLFTDDVAFIANREVGLGFEMRPIQYFLREHCLLRIQLQGHLEEDFGSAHYSRRGSHSSFIYPGAGTHYGLVLQRQKPISSVTLSFRPAYLQGFFSVDELEKLEIWNNGALSASPQFIQLLASAKLLELGNRMLALDLSQNSARLVGKGLMLQVIGEAVQQVLQRKQQESAMIRLRQQDIERLNAIRARIDGALAEPHTIEQLARWGGLNRRKLNEGFKVLFGTTVADYLLRKRMLAARELLQQGEPVGVAAEAAGYQDRTSFSRAYRRVHGHSPNTSRNPA